VPFNGCNTFFKANVLVFNFGGQVQPGQYSFPFVFQIPMGLPGVFEGTSSSQARGSISYSIHGECEVGGMFNANIRHQQNFVINELLQENIVPITELKVANVKLCCCITRGHARLSVHVSKNCFAPGEVAQVICEVRNSSTESFSTIRVKLVRTMLLWAQHHSHRCVDVVSENDYGGVGANAVHVGPEALQLPLQLAPNIYPSVHGRTVQCSYQVQVTLVSSGCFVGNLNVTVPVRIYAPQSPPPPVFQQAPPGWSPQMLPAVSVSIPPLAPQVLPPPCTGNTVAMQPGYQQLTGSGSGEIPQ